MDRPQELAPVPRAAVADDGTPRFGSYAGMIESAGLANLRGTWARGPLYRFTHHKSWRWGMAADARVMVAFALVDVGYAANAFLFVVDLQARRMLVDRTALGLPFVSVRIGERPNDGSDARFDGGGLHLRISRPTAVASFHVEAHSQGVEVDMELDAVGAPPPLVLVAPVPQGTVNVTQKSACLAARGTIRAAGITHELTGASGGFDYTNGLLARHTAWRWAFATGTTADGRGAGLNVVSGFNDAGATSENVLWLEGEVIPLGRLQFKFDKAAPLEPWTITNDDGSVDVVFRPLAMHREDRNLGVARSHFVQVAGTFGGVIRRRETTVRLVDLPGVTEDQDIMW